MTIHRNIRLLRWFDFFTSLKLYTPIAIIYFSQVTDSFALGMSIFSITFLAAALFEVPTGIFSDLIGRKNTLILGALSAVVFSIFYAIGSSYWILVIGAIFEGLSRSFYSGNNEALLYDSIAAAEKESDFHHQLGKKNFVAQLALAISAALGSVAASVSFSLLMWVSVIPQIICLLLSLNIVDVKKLSDETGNIYTHLTESIQIFWTNIKLRRLSLAHIINYGIAEAAFDFQAAFYKTVWPLWAIGFAKMLSYIAASISTFMSGKIIDYFGPEKIILIRHTYNRIAFAIALIFPSPASPLLMSSGSLLFGPERVATSMLLHKEYTDRQRATMGSLNALGGSLLFGVAAPIIGLLADRFGPALALLVAQVCLLPVIWIYWKIYTTNNNLSIRQTLA